MNRPRPSGSSDGCKGVSPSNAPQIGVQKTDRISSFSDKIGSFLHKIGGGRSRGSLAVSGSEGVKERGEFESTEKGTAINAKWN